jgi:3-dehydroquinate synthase
MSQPARFPLHVAREWDSPCLLGAGALAEMRALWPDGAETAVVVADRRVWRLHGAALQRSLRGVARFVHVLPFAPGERSKSWRTLGNLLDLAVAVGARRHDVVLGLGGGVATDLAGCVAALCQRGMHLVQVPTSLLGMVDAALGGKAAVDLRLGKNLAGAFVWPRAVLVEPAFLATLPARHLRSGLAEVIKAGVVGDAGLVAAAEACGRGARGRPAVSEELLARAVAVKAAVVGRDPFEQGERRVLNLGHTVAHALEAASGYRLDHGTAVALGLMVEGRVAQAVTGFPSGDLEAMARALGAVLGELRLPVPVEEALPWMGVDKKGAAGRIRMSLPRGLGRMEPAGGAYVVEVPEGLIRACWHAG